MYVGWIRQHLNRSYRLISAYVVSIQDEQVFSQLNLSIATDSSFCTVCTKRKVNCTLCLITLAILKIDTSNLQDTYIRMSLIRRLNNTYCYMTGENPVS